MKLGRTKRHFKSKFSAAAEDRGLNTQIYGAPVL